MFRKIRQRNGSSVLEYSMVIAVVLLALLAFHRYIYRAMAGKWKEAGDTFGYGKQYDPEKTTDCGFSPISNVWYEMNCADSCESQFDMWFCAGARRRECWNAYFHISGFNVTVDPQLVPCITGTQEYCEEMREKCRTCTCITDTCGEGACSGSLNCYGC